MDSFKILPLAFVHLKQSVYFQFHKNVHQNYYFIGERESLQRIFNNKTRLDILLKRWFALNHNKVHGLR